MRVQQIAPGQIHLTTFIRNVNIATTSARVIILRLLLVRASAGVRFALRCEAVEVVRSAFRDLLTAQLAESDGGGFAQQVIEKLDCGPEKFAAACGPAFRQSVVVSSKCASSIMLRSARRSVRFLLAIGPTVP